MRISQIKMGAVIPNAQYSNLQPEVTVDLTAKDDIEEAKKLALSHIEGVSRMYAEEGKALVAKGADLSAVEREVMKCYLSGAELLFDPISHTYVDSEGNQYTSGSAYAEQFTHEFKKDAILPGYAERNNVTEAEVEEFWNAKADVSTTFGTALHKAMEVYGKYHELALHLGKTVGLHPTLQPIVEAFYKDRMDEKAEYEPFVADTENKRCGQIDRLVITGDKTCIIDDFKTNGDLETIGKPKTLKKPYTYLANNNIGKYHLQLSFYAAIVEANGWKVEAVRLQHWDGTRWKEYSLKPLQLDVRPGRIDVGAIV